MWQHTAVFEQWMNAIRNQRFAGRDAVPANYRIQQALASSKRVFEVLDTEPHVKDKPDAIKLPRLRGEVMYTRTVMDVFSRRVIGWKMATHLRTDLVIDALEMALVQRRPISVIHTLVSLA